MTVSTASPRNDYIGSGTTGPFPFTFPLQAAAHLQVIKRDLTSGGETTLTSGVDYTLAGSSWLTGGSITLLASLSSSYALTLRRIVPILQQVDLRNQGAFFAEVHETEFDQLVMICQQQQDQLDRSLKLPTTETGTALGTTLPAAALRASKYMGFDLSGNPVVLSNPLAVTALFDIGLVQVVDTIAALKALPTPSGAVQYFVRGYYAAGDGGEGVLRWNSSDATTDNAGTVLIPNSAPGVGRWNRAVVGPINARWFGAKGDGTNDDTTAIQAAITYIGTLGGGALLIPAGTYKITANLNMVSNLQVYGVGAATILKAATNGIYVLRGTAISHFSIKDLAIDGGGQTSDILTGVAAVMGINLNGCTYFTIERVKISKCGIKNGAAPGTDSAYAGMGIALSAAGGECAWGVIRDCRIFSIAGGGNNNGDGISINSFGTPSIITHDISVENCWVSTCGRHAASVAGVLASGLCRSVTFRKCFFEKSGLCGIDIEDATRTTVDDCRFSACGNDQTYYNPAVLYGATYRLIAGLATNAVDCTDLTVEDCKFSGCYYGVTWSNTLNLKLFGCSFELGTFADLQLGGAQCPNEVRITDCAFLSTVSAMSVAFISADNKGVFEFARCKFATLIQISQSYDLTFRGCSFLAGVQFIASGIERPSFIDCNFEDFAGSAVTHSAISQLVRNATFRGCRFIGAGALVNGLSLQFDDATGWVVEGCEFLNLTGAGITHANAAGGTPFASISRNLFRSCVTGMVFNQAPINGVIDGNTFSSITGWCIDISGIASGANMGQMTIVNNVAGASVTNGLRIAVGTGAWDWCLVSYNNMHLAATTKWSLAAGNGNGLSTNNLTT